MNGKTLWMQSSSSKILITRHCTNFLQFDLKDFYPSIKETLLNEAI